MGKRRLMIFLIVASAKVNSAIALGEQGKIINCKGKVEHNPAAQQAWKSAKVFQNLFITDKVRTFVASRSDILLVNEARARLTRNLTLQESQQYLGTQP